MFRIIRRVARAPLVYLADLRQLRFKQYLLIHTNFSPSYPIMIVVSLLTTLFLGIFIIYEMFTLPQGDNCFSNVRNGAYVIAILYPIETILIFICITGSIALSKSNIWKVIWILLFGPMLCGIGYGELAFIEMCLLETYNPNTFDIASIFTQQAFIDSMVYLYITFLVLYFMLVPSFQFLYRRQKEDREERKKLEERNKQLKKSRQSRASRQQSKSKNDIDQPQEPEQQLPEAGSSCGSRCVCVLYYGLSILFALSFLFIAVIKIIGPILYTYVWIKISTNKANYDRQNQQILFGLMLTAYFAPFGLTVIILSIQRIFKLGRKQPDLEDSVQDKNTIDLSDGENSGRKTDPLGQIAQNRRDSINMSDRKSRQVDDNDDHRMSMSEQKRSARDSLL